MAFETVGVRAVVEGASSYVADMHKMKAAEESVTRGLAGMGQQAQSSGGFLKSMIGSAAGFAGAQLAMQGLSKGFGLVKSSIFGMNEVLETSKLQFETLFQGDATRAAEHVANLFEFAKKTPFETGPIIEASRLLQTFGGDALNTMDNLTLLGDAAAGTNAPINELGFWTGRLYAALQAGAPFGESAARLSELAVITPTARAEMEAMQKAGKSADEIYGVFQKNLGRFSGSMIKQASTWRGLVSTFKDSVAILSSTAFKPLFDFAKKAVSGINDFLSKDSVTKAIQNFSQRLGEGAEKAWDLMVSGFKRVVSAGTPVVAFFMNLGRYLALVVSEGDSLNDWLSHIPSWLQPVVLAFGKLVNGIKDGITSLIAIVKNPAVGTAFAEMAESILRVAGLLGGAIWSNIRAVAVPVLNALADAFGRVFGTGGGEEGASKIVGIFTRIKEALDSLDPKTIDIIAKAITAIILALAANVAFGAVSALAGFAANIVSYPLKKAKEVYDSIAKIVNGIKQAVSKTVNFVQNVLQRGKPPEALEECKDCEETVTQTVKVQGDKPVEVGKNLTQTITQNIKVDSGGMETTGKESAAKFAQSFAGALAGSLATALVTTGMGAALIAGIGAIAVPAAIALAVALAVGLAVAFPTEFGNVVGAITGALVLAFIGVPALLATTLVSGLGIAFQAAFGILKVIFVQLPIDLAGAFLGNLGTAFGQVGAIFSALLQGNFVEAGRQAVGLVKTLFISLPTDILASFTSAFSSIGTIIGGAAKQIGGEITKLGAEILSRFAALIPGLSNLDWGAIGRAIITALGVALQAVIDWGAKFIAGFVSTFAQSTGITREQVGQIVSTIMGIPGQIAGLPGQLYAWAIGAMGKMFDGIDTGWSAVFNFFTQMPGEIMSAIGDVGGKLFGLGVDMIQGLIGGITSMAGRAKDAAVGVVKGAYDGAKDFLRVNSPSLIFMDLGSSVGEGLTVGIESESGAVAQAATDLVEDALTAASVSAIEKLDQLAFGRTIVGKFGQLGKDISQELIETITVGTADAGSRLASSVDSMIQEAIEVGVPGAADLGRRIREALGATLSAGGTAETLNPVLDLLGQMSGGILSANTLTADSLGAALGGIRDARTLQNAVGSAGVSIMDALNAALAEGGANNIRTLAGNADSLMETLRDALPEGQAAYIGSKFMTGLQDSIASPGEEAMSRLKAALTDANAVVQGGAVDIRTGTIVMGDSIKDLAKGVGLSGEQIIDNIDTVIDTGLLGMIGKLDTLPDAVRTAVAAIIKAINDGSKDVDSGITSIADTINGKGKGTSLVDDALKAGLDFNASAPITYVDPTTGVTMSIPRHLYDQGLLQYASEVGPGGSIGSQPTTGGRIREGSAVAMSNTGRTYQVATAPRPTNQNGGTQSINFDMRGAQFTGTPAANEAMMRTVVRDELSQQTGRELFMSGG